MILPRFCSAWEAREFWFCKRAIVPTRSRETSGSRTSATMILDFIEIARVATFPPTIVVQIRSKRYGDAQRMGMRTLIIYGIDVFATFFGPAVTERGGALARR
jgi:hypothetical protein